MATKHLTIYHCDICGEKVNGVLIYFWGVMIYYTGSASELSHPESVTECCVKCKHILDDAIAKLVSKHEPE